jgi:hypothetical protein
MVRPQRDIQAAVLELLRNLKGIEPLKELFWSQSQLNYSHVNQSLSRRGWGDAATQALAEDPVLFASGGADEAFHVIYARLAADGKPRRTDERPVVSRLLRDHPYALFVFSNEAQDRWHFLNVKYDEKTDKRRLFRRIAVGPEERLRTASERVALLDLASVSPTLFGLAPLDIQKRHDEAFDVEAVTRQFYGEYEAAFFALQKDLAKQVKDPRWAHDYALQFLNRCMFLYFVQRKRWLGGDGDFLANFWQAYRTAGQPKDTFFERWLKVLFFEAFNNRFHGGHRHFPKPIQDALAMAPFLNGGLFAENDLDRRPGFEIADARFEQVFTFLERYNFTIAEDSPLDQEVAVDPQMIGKVYESLVNVPESQIDERGEAGIFYTPRTEIDLMCRLALVDNLANHLGERHKNLFYEAVFALEPEEKVAADAALAKARLWPAVNDRLRQLTVVDLACGSGSFLVGMLHVLDDLTERANRALGVAEEPFDRKRRIIGQSLYGVDVMEWACHVAELRLWLALIIDAEFKCEELHCRKDPLLPHFTFKIRCGDSLVQEVGGINLGHRRGSHDIPKSVKDRLRRLQNAKVAFYNNVPASPEKVKREIEHEEVAIFRDLLAERAGELDRQAKGLMRLQEAKRARQRNLLSGELEERSEQLTLEREAREKEIERLRDEKARLEASRQAMKRPEDVPFVWDIAFAEVMESEAGGFDIVIGNPPYVRQENIAAPIINGRRITEDKKGYKAKLARSVYQAWDNFFRYKVTAAGETVGHKLDAKSDLYIYFYFHGLTLLAKKGSFCFITSNSWLDVGYGADLQEFLLKHSHVKLVMDNQVKRTFANADVNSIIALLASPDDKTDWGLDQTARFVMFKVPFEHVLSPVIFEEVEAASQRKITPEYRVFPSLQAKLLEDGCELPEEEDEPQEPAAEKRPRGPLIKVARYIGNKWGGKYLRAPDIYWTILEKGKGKLVRLGDIATVRPGCYAGINDFFYLSRDTLREWEIEPECLRRLIRTSRDIRCPRIPPSAIDQYVFYCPFSKKEMKERGLHAALAYISWGEKQVTRQRMKTAAGIPWPETETVKRRVPGWWSIPAQNVEPTYNFLVYVIGERFLAPWSERPLASDRCFHRLFCGEPLSDRLALSINCSLTLLFMSLFGRGNLGQGAQKFETADAKNLLIFSPSELPGPSSWADLLKDFGRRAVLPIAQEIAAKDRRDLDQVVLESLRLTKGEREAVYEAVVNLVEARLSKAETV